MKEMVIEYPDQDHESAIKFNTLSTTRKVKKAKSACADNEVTPYSEYFCYRIKKEFGHDVVVGSGYK